MYSSCICIILQPAGTVFDRLARLLHSRAATAERGVDFMISFYLRKDFDFISHGIAAAPYLTIMDLHTSIVGRRRRYIVLSLLALYRYKMYLRVGRISVLISIEKKIFRMQECGGRLGEGARTTSFLCEVRTCFDKIFQTIDLFLSQKFDQNRASIIMSTILKQFVYCSYDKMQ